MNSYDKFRQLLSQRFRFSKRDWTNPRHSYILRILIFLYEMRRRGKFHEGKAANGFYIAQQIGWVETRREYEEQRVQSHISTIISAASWLFPLGSKGGMKGGYHWSMLGERRIKHGVGRNRKSIERTDPDIL